MALGITTGKAEDTGPEGARSALWKLIPVLFMGEQGWDQLTSLPWGQPQRKGTEVTGH